MSKKSEKDCRLRRFALQVVQQLPENRLDALIVLEFMREIVAWEHGAVIEAATNALKIVG